MAPDPRVPAPDGAGGQNLGHLKMYDKTFVKVSQADHISVSIPIWTIVTLEGYESHHGSKLLVGVGCQIL